MEIEMATRKTRVKKATAPRRRDAFMGTRDALISEFRADLTAAELIALRPGETIESPTAQPRPIHFKHLTVHEVRALVDALEARQ
jgi:hypothetical protein